MTDFTMTIGGGPVATKDTFPVVNPATAEPFAQAPECSSGQLDEAMESAAKAYHDWHTEVWSGDPERAAGLAERLECGTAWVNAHGGLNPGQPFGGLKWSGIGVENGTWGLYGYTELQVLVRPR